MNKKRIVVLHAQIPFVRGGAENVVETLTKQLVRRGYLAEIIQLPWKWYPCNSLLDNVMAWRMLDLTEGDGQKVDMVIGCKFPSYVARHPNKVLWLMHQHRMAYDLYDRKEFGGMKYMPNGAETREKIVKIDNLCFDECVGRFAISKNMVGRMERYNGRTAEAIYHPPALEGRYYCNEFGNYILSAGRLVKIKRNDLLIRSLPYCDRKIQVKIAGVGPDKKDLQVLAKKLGVDDRVEFLGFVSDEDLLKLYSDAFAVYYAPVDEDYGYITLEAFLSKKPIVTCRDSGGVLEFVSDQQNGFVTDMVPEALGKRINDLYMNKKRAQMFGLEGFEIVKDISWDYLIDRLTETLR